MIWRLRVGELDGVDVQAAAEIDSGGIEGEASHVSPKIELVSGSAATETAEEITADVNREAPWIGRDVAATADRAGATPLRPALAEGLVTQKFQHAADGDAAADGQVVDLAHDLRSLASPVPPELVRRPRRAAFCSARYAR